MSARSSASSYGKQRTGHGALGISTPNVEPPFGSGYPIHTRSTRSFSCRSITSCLLVGLSVILGLLTVLNTTFSLCVIRQTYRGVTPLTWVSDFTGLKSINYICEIIHPIPIMPNGMDARLNALEDRFGYQQHDGENIDVAIFSTGARIIPQLTGPFDPNNLLPKGNTPISLWYHNLPLLSWVFGTALEPARAAVPQPSATSRATREMVTRLRIVLEDLLINGDCWQFDGHTGQVAIQFPHPVNITGMTVHYVHPRILVPTARKQAPRLLILWALLEGRNNTDSQINTSSRILQTSDVQSEHPRTAISFLNPAGLQSLPDTMSDSDIFLPIITAEYLLNDLRPVQMFPRTLPGDTLVQTVVIEVLSNWGADSTCLYHIGIHAHF